MADPRFFQNHGPFTLATLANLSEATLLDATLPDPAGADREIRDVAALDEAEADHVSFLENAKYIQSFINSRAGAFFIHPDLIDKAPAGMTLLVSKTPRRAFALAAQAFYPIHELSTSRHAGAHIDPTAVVDPSCRIDAGAVIGARAQIGARCIIEANAVIGAGVEIGEECRIGANASVQYAVLGNRVVIYSGARIGESGFGFHSDANGHTKIPQVGRVLIGDDVEIGANTTVDRGAGPDTIIGRGTMIDNLVQIAHNVVIGENCVLVSLTGIAGSSSLGNFVTLAAQASVAGHVSIGDGATLVARTGVSKSLAGGQFYGGAPARPIQEWKREIGAIRALAKRKGK